MSDYWTPKRIGLAMLLIAAAVPLGVWGGSELKAQFLKTARTSLELFDLENLQVPRGHLIHAGPPKDGIPALTNPRTVPIAEADFLSREDRVIGVAVNGEARAYPVTVLNYHEVINDELGGAPIAVIFCPLCDSVSVVDRRVGETVLEFGITGYLYQSNVVLYDRNDHALWSQVGLIALSGPYAGRSLRHYSTWRITPFSEWKKARPDSTVVSLQTGHRRNYAESPYHDYLRSDRLMFPVSRVDERLANKTPVVGVRYGNAVRAYPVERILGAEGGTVRDGIGGGTLELRASDDGDTIIVVQAPRGAFVVHTFWFAWYAFHPGTEVYGEGRGQGSGVGGQG